MPSPIDSSLYKKDEIALNTYEVFLKLDEPLGFKPGQYVWIILPKLDYPDPKGERRAFSISSSSEDKKTISIILRGSESGYKKTLLNLAMGSRLKIVGPHGQSFVLKENEPDVCFIAGGVGVAPFLEIVSSKETESLKNELTLINLNSSKEKAFLVERVEGLTKEKKLKFINHIGHFNTRLLSSLPRPKSTIYFVSGPQEMVDYVYKRLKLWGIEDSQMRFEQFYPSPEKTLKGFGNTEGLSLESSHSFKNTLVGGLYSYCYYLIFAVVGFLIVFYSVFLKAPFIQTRFLYVILGVLVSNFIIFKINKNINYLLNTTIALIMGIFGWTVWNGDLNGLIVCWLYFFPVLTFFSLGKRKGAIWTALFIVMIGIIYVFSFNNLTPYYYGPLFATISVLSLTFTSFLAFFASSVTETVNDSLGRSVSLRESYKLAVDSTSDHIVITDINGKILYANKAAEKITGYSIPEMIGNTPRLWGGQMDPDFYEKMWDLKKNKKEHFVGEITNVRKGGAEYTAIIKISKIYENGKLIGFVATEEDITKLKEVDKLKDEFLSTASHELRTPLSAIDGIVSMVRGGEYGKVSGSVKSALDDVNESSSRLINLVNDLLSLSRIQAGRLKYNLSVFDVMTPIENVSNLFAPAIKERGLKFSIDGRVSSKVQGDSDKVEQIITNLINNSLKFTKTGKIAIRVLEEKDLVKVFIEDTGIGIDKKDQNLLFGKFQQVGKNKASTQGTGLGLHISQEMIKKMGGEIWLERSDLGKGAVFAFSLPKDGTNLAKKVRDEIGKEALENPDQKYDTIKKV